MVTVVAESRIGKVVLKSAITVLELVALAILVRCSVNR